MERREEAILFGRDEESGCEWEGGGSKWDSEVLPGRGVGWSISL